MEYISVKTIAQKWGIDTSRVGRLAREGRIPGAKLVGHNWLIPLDAEKPLDNRLAEVKSNPIGEEVRNFRFPSYSYAPADSFSPPLTQDEKKLREVELLINECRFGDARRALGNLPTTAVNRYCRCGALYAGCIIAINEADVFSYSHLISRFATELKEEFPYKREIEILYHLVFACFGSNEYFINQFHLDPSYSYHSSAYPILLACSAYSVFTSNLRGLTDDSLTILELNCQTLESTGFFEEAQSIHISLLILNFLHQNKKNIELHARKILRLAYEHHLYFLPASYMPYYGECFEHVLKDFPEVFVEMIREASNAIHTRYLRFSSRMNFSGFYDRLPEKYYSLVNYALTDLPNKAIASRMGLSESTINNRYSEIYDILGLKGKQELKQFYREKLSTGGNESGKKTY